jgi:hypothetical protein
MSFHNKLAVVALLLTSTATYAGALSVPDLHLDVSWNKPRNDDNWDNSNFAFTVQGLFWRTKELALAASLGVEKRDANTDTVNTSADGVTGRLRGDADITYLGVSAIYRMPLQGNLSWQGELGIKYAIVSSNVDLTYSNGTDSTTDNVDMDNAFLGLLAADLVYKVNPQLSVLVGGGVLSDIDKGHAKAFGEKDDNTLGSAFLRLGTQISF